MSFLLDTNICSAFLKRRPGPLAHRFFQHSGNLAISSVTLAELYTWAHHRDDTPEMLGVIDRDILADCRLIDFNSACAARFGAVRGSLLKVGVVTNQVDLMIAATALEHDLTLVTSNVKHFQSVHGLRIEDWLDG